MVSINILNKGTCKHTFKSKKLVFLLYNYYKKKPVLTNIFKKKGKLTIQKLKLKDFEYIWTK